MSKLPSYPKIFSLGHPSIRDLFQGRVIVQEKIDGSQFSFGLVEGELICRSKGKQLYLDAPDKMFAAGIEYIQTIKNRLVEGYVYRGEYLRGPKHNTLHYERMPANHIILFDVMFSPEIYASPESLAGIAECLDLEAVPCYHAGEMDLTKFQNYMEKESCLGGQTVEGVVAKNYHRYDEYTGHVLMGKYVSEAFKEVHVKGWKESNPSKQDIIGALCDTYRCPTRWEKAVYRLRDEDKLTNSPKDIGTLLTSIQEDIIAECEADIKERLWKAFSNQILRSSIAGFPEWYKKRLLDQQFNEVLTDEQRQPEN